MNRSAILSLVVQGPQKGWHVKKNSAKNQDVFTFTIVSFVTLIGTFPQNDLFRKPTTYFGSLRGRLSQTTPKSHQPQS